MLCSCWQMAWPGVGNIMAINQELHKHHTLGNDNCIFKSLNKFNVFNYLCSTFCFVPTNVISVGSKDKP